MSKPEKPAKASTTLQLRKDLSQAGKVFQGLTNSIEKIESSLDDAETARTNDRSLKEEILLIQRESTRLRDAHQKVQNERQQDMASFADHNLKLAKEYNTRLTQVELEYESKIKEYQRHGEVTESKWKQQVILERTETQRLKQAESISIKEIESQLRKAREDWQEKEEQLQNKLQQCEDQISELSNKTDTLGRELNENETMLRGRDTEIQRLRGRLAALEAFPPRDGTDEVAVVIDGVQARLREFCFWCVDFADTLPGWHPFPDGIRYNHLPRSYSSESDSGRYVFVAAIQHSICKAMEENFLLPFGAYADRRLWDVSEVLFQKNHSHEAIWRLLTVNTILGDQRLLSECKKTLREVATALLLSWKPFPGEHQKKEILERLTQLLIDSAIVSLELQRIRKRIHVSVDVVSDYFDSDPEEDSHKVPVGFELPDSTAPVLCLFPAFFWPASPAANSQPNLLRKGTAMFRDSPPLLAALNDEQAVRSPRMSNKKKPIT